MRRYKKQISRIVTVAMLFAFLVGNSNMVYAMGATQVGYASKYITVKGNKMCIRDRYEAVYMNVSEEKLLKLREETGFERVGQYYIVGDIPSDKMCIRDRNTSTGDLMYSAAKHAKGLAADAQKESSYDSAGRQSVQHAIQLSLIHI